MKYLVADFSDHPGRPLLTYRPLYVGVGPSVPVAHFGDAGLNWEVISVLPVGDEFNPFHVPVVKARRVR